MCRLIQGNLYGALSHLLTKKQQFEIDFRKAGVSQDAILQDEAKMSEINEKLEKSKMGRSAKSIRNDLSKGKMIFSEETSRAIYEMGNMGLLELKQTTATIHVRQCGVWLRPNQSTMARIRIAFAAFVNSILSHHSIPVKREKMKCDPRLVAFALRNPAVDMFVDGDGPAKRKHERRLRAFQRYVRWTACVTTPTTSPRHLSAFRLMTLCLPRP